MKVDAPPIFRMRSRAISSIWKVVTPGATAAAASRRAVAAMRPASRMISSSQGSLMIGVWDIGDAGPLDPGLRLAGQPFLDGRLRGRARPQHEHPDGAEDEEAQGQRLRIAQRPEP